MTLEVGKHTYFAMGDKSLVIHEGGLIKIGKFCSIAHRVSIMVHGNHRGDWITTFPFPYWFGVCQDRDWDQRKDVTIGNDVWIGTGAIIIGGAIIGDGAIIGAGAVVVDDISPYAVACGSPAVVKKYRFDSFTIKRLMDLEWWDLPEDKIKRLIPVLLSSDINQLITEVSKCI